MVAPDDVTAVAADEGIPIYVISTSEVNKDPISSASFRRISTRMGGKAYWAKTWQKQVEAFEDIREDLGSSYTVAYYPAANRNEGFRKILVEVANDPGKKLRVRCRPVSTRLRRYGLDSGQDHSLTVVVPKRSCRGDCTAGL